MHTNGQQVYEKVLNIHNHQENAKQNHNIICWDGYYQRQYITNVGEDVEKKESLCTGHGNVY